MFFTFPRLTRGGQARRQGMGGGIPSGIGPPHLQTTTGEKALDHVNQPLGVLCYPPTDLLVGEPPGLKKSLWFPAGFA